MEVLKLNKKEFYEKTLKIYKPLYDAIKREKLKQKAERTYDLVTITDRETGKSIDVHIGINCIDRVMKKGKKDFLKKMLYMKMM